MKIVLLLLLAVALLEHTAEALVRGEQRKEDQPRARELKGSMDSGGSGDDGDTGSDTDAIIDAITDAACFSAISTVQHLNSAPLLHGRIPIQQSVFPIGRSRSSQQMVFSHYKI
ncbi:expressed unknown protein [Seminavis robusta]|uniref:Uncharacterized protein n=1 Tax=Seminavis robusta TaxID=568900 RepID=A0A9N8EI68_9STRA|nr:expressed unknown protein [Seminavis robusta]|eukprot:Sro1140_g245560.1 n/a (114) ;mRNA; f:28217-28626